MDKNKENSIFKSKNEFFHQIIILFTGNKLLNFVIWILFIVFLSPKADAQTFNGIGGIIPDNGDSVVFSIPVTGLYPSLIDTIFGIESVCIDAVHTWDSDLYFALISPDGTTIILTNGNGGSGDNYSGTCFTDTSALSIIQGSPPFSGDFCSQEDLGFINNGQNGNGTWTLYVLDIYPFADQGELFSWSITFGNNPAIPFHFESSNLPIVAINTFGQHIPDDPKITAGFGIIDNGPGNRNYLTDTLAYKGLIGIELRGSSSQSFPKKSYGLETTDSLGNTIDTILLGLPSENDWILNASYSDKTLLRNVMTYQFWRNMGHYATRSKYCELMINGKYQGIYFFQEKIKRDSNRVDIAKLTVLENSGDNLTGGYIIKIDKATGSNGDGWTSTFPPPINPNGQTIYFQYDYPDGDIITFQQKAYIQAYVDSFETALASNYFADTIIGFRKYASEQSFIDYYIINEVSKNVDGYRLSTFLHKNKNSNGGKLKIGPVWDYDIAWHNADYCDGEDYLGWAYQFPCNGDYWQIPFWWSRFLQDSLFTRNLRCRWEELRTGFLSNDSIYAYIDSVALLLNEAKDRNFTVWPILGLYVWPNPAPFPATYAEEIISLKSWISSRMNWLDANIMGVCISSIEKTVASLLKVYPNPAINNLFLELPENTGSCFQIIINNASGELVKEMPCNAYESVFSINIASLKPGLYMLTVKTQTNIFRHKFVKTN